LSDSQRKYVSHYCDTLNEAIFSGEDGQFTIDMDQVADATAKDSEKPSFYVSEESQQHKFKCLACGEFNDVIGRYAYCSACATRNDAAEFVSDMSELRKRVAERQGSNTVRDGISAFDNIAGQLTKQFLQLVPLSKRRRVRLRRGRFHDLNDIVEVLSWFDIDLIKRISVQEQEFVRRMFLRRHVYEHAGGEVDQSYLDKSRDNSVRLKQRLSETVEDQHKLINLLSQMVGNLADGFHEILPPLEDPIKAHTERLERRKVHAAHAD
jgi:hypothetical protein